MSNSYTDFQQNNRGTNDNREGSRGGFRGNRGGRNKDGGGFRIRLSENEMKAARALQDAFNLRSTVAVLGFALRTLAEMLQEGKLTELLEKHQSTKGRDGYQSADNRHSDRRGESYENNDSQKPNPFARPDKPQTTSNIDVESSNKEDSDLNSGEQIDNPEKEINESVADVSTESEAKSNDLETKSTEVKTES